VKLLGGKIPTFPECSFSGRNQLATEVRMKLMTDGKQNQSDEMQLLGHQRGVKQTHLPTTGFGA
jgi:hypothetical protein